MTSAALVIWLLLSIDYHPSGGVKTINVKAYLTEANCRDRLAEVKADDKWCFRQEVEP